MRREFLLFGKRIYEKIIDMLPPGVRAEIVLFEKSNADYPVGLSEVRLRRYGRSYIVYRGENMPLRSRITAEEWDALALRVMAGAAYAHKDTIEEGYISAAEGLRVGVCADGTYENSRFVFSGNITALSFRVPSTPSENAEKLYLEFMRQRRGVLIYSKPAGGKTSLLRALAYLIGGVGGMRLVAVDQRRELHPELYPDSFVDILSGYKKAKGIEIAVRTLNAEVVIVDEIGSAKEAEAISAVGDGGALIIATAHSPSKESLMQKPGVRELISDGRFGILAGLRREGCGGERAGIRERFVLDIQVI